MILDKTHLSNFSGDKSAWPVYLTIGNIKKSGSGEVSGTGNCLFRTNFIESAFLERCFIARLHCFRLGNHNRIHTEKQYVCL